MHRGCSTFGSGAKGLAMVIVSAAAAGGVGTVVLARRDENFRTGLENRLPAVSPVLEAILGPTKPAKVPPVSLTAFASVVLAAPDALRFRCSSTETSGLF